MEAKFKNDECVSSRKLYLLAAKEKITQKLLDFADVLFSLQSYIESK